MITPRATTLREMQALTSRLWPSRWHVGDLAWTWYQYSGREDEWRTALWEHDGRAVAWAWAKPAGRFLNLQLDPAHPDLADDVLSWFAELTEGPGPRTVKVLDDEQAVIDALAAHGYRERTDRGFFLHLGRSLAELPEPEVPDGYTLRQVGPEDAAARAAVHRAAFPAARATAGSYRDVMNAWPYRHDLDWLVTAPDGSPASFCLVWLDEATGAAILEPVGTAPGHLRRGLASAAILAALRTARDLGAETARVCVLGHFGNPPALAAYTSVGFRGFARDRTYEQP
ncbi:GNAT family N-acetyltransferase [Spirillospora sp. NPDC047279]|uniref:GNAT family N-acetyltransferase n=1 Tax=Spirillospora sp. NPDC047279 TaxID=3155478 RepID=UPI0033D97B18